VNLELLVGVSDAELVNRYQTAKLLICAQHLEPFGLVALEAAACGTPVVAVREAGLRESVMENDTGVFAPDRDPVTISRLIDETLSDTVGLRRLSGRAVEAVRTTWTWERTARRLLVHLSSIVQPSANQTDLKRLSLP
jgi:glycosyltransferase involved in cell wall biosynthesis